LIRGRGVSRSGGMVGGRSISGGRGMVGGGGSLVCRGVVGGWGGLVGRGRGVVSLVVLQEGFVGADLSSVLDISVVLLVLVDVVVHDLGSAVGKLNRVLSLDGVAVPLLLPGMVVGESVLVVPGNLVAELIVLDGFLVVRSGLGMVGGRVVGCRGRGVSLGGGVVGCRGRGVCRWGGMVRGRVVGCRGVSCGGGVVGSGLVGVDR